jgi:protein TonB
MSLESESVSHPALGSLQSCLVEGDSEQRARERRVRGKALTTSVLLQASFLAVLILVPLFAKPAHLVRPMMTPIPPYRAVPDTAGTVRQPQPATRRACFTCFNPNPRPVTLTPASTQNTHQPVDPFEQTDGTVPAPCPGCINLGAKDGPRPPVPSEPRREKPRIVHTQISAAMLIHRVEPTYPTLARQTRRAGRVELRAVIATDGTIQFLQVVSGDPLFYQSAMDAVRQWRYRPTVLNGEPVEIDTFISVIYNIER